MNKMITAVLAGATALATAGTAYALGTYPAKPVHIIVGAGPGGGLDLIARVIAPKLGEWLNQSFVVENRAGASAMIATEYVAKAVPDGYTLLLASPGAITVNPVVLPKVNYSPTKDFAPIPLIVSLPLVLVVDPEAPIRSIPELIAYAKANPAKSNAGGSGYAAQLVLEMFKMKTGIPLEFIQYKGGGEVATAVMAGQLLMTIIDTPPVSGALKADRIRGLAVTTPKRISAFPQLPTLSEAGVRDMDVYFWAGLMAPAGTPPAIVSRLEAEVKNAVTLPDVLARFASLEAEPEGSSAAEFGRFVVSEIARWTGVAKTGNIKFER
ncbi:MAG: tripartite tricarboxylate transporter substrate binding protein [Betaproteobacteria bacterium]|nr:tripartite tricarboxylate transporter substrate binding protein [Betaproteobacteria bacterium]